MRVCVCPLQYAVMVAAKQARALHDLEHMRFQYEDVVCEQGAVGGLLISRALYGEPHTVQCHMHTQSLVRLFPFPLRAFYISFALAALCCTVLEVCFGTFAGVVLE